MDCFAQNLSTSVVQHPFPILSNFPFLDNVNPGIGQLVDMHHLFVPVMGKSSYNIEKKADIDNDQIGTGEENKTESVNVAEDAKMDPQIVESFSHPKRIKTEKIVLPQNIAPKRKSSFNSAGQGLGMSDLKKMRHSFKFDD